MKSLLIIAGLLILASCTDTDWKNLTTLGSSGTVKCYSGGVLVYQGTSTGKIQTVQHSDGWEFEDSSTHKFIRVSGTCVIQN